MVVRVRSPAGAAEADRVPVFPGVSLAASSDRAQRRRELLRRIVIRTRWRGAQRDQSGHQLLPPRSPLATFVCARAEACGFVDFLSLMRDELVAADFHQVDGSRGEEFDQWCR